MTKQRKGELVSGPKTALPQFFTKRVCEGGFILMLTAALFILLSLVTYSSYDPGWFHPASDSINIANAGGTVGAYFADALYASLGYVAYLLPGCFVYIAWMILKDHRVLQTISKPVLVLRLAGLFFLLGSACGLLALELSPEKQMLHRPGGFVGHVIAFALSHTLNVQGATLLLFAMLLVGVTWLTGLSWLHVTEIIGYYTLIALHWLKFALKHGIRFAQILMARLKAHAFKEMLRAKEATQPTTLKVKKEKEKEKAEKTSPKISLFAEKPQPPKPMRETPAFTKIEVTGSLPSLELLNKGEVGEPMRGYTHQELETLSRDVEQHLLDFGIQADVVAVHPGPVITRFELQLAAGVKVSKLTALSKDLARSLSVTSVRVVEIIPGKTVVGIELPNLNRATVGLSEVLSAEVYQKAHSPLTLALGVDIAGHPMVVDLAKMPHLLVAGTTGSGKSVGINAMILSLLFKATPEQVRLIMVDPKMLELSVYDGIPHLLTPVVTDMKEAASALRWCVAEMERRYRLMAAFGVRNLAGFNSKLAEAAARGEPLTDPLWKPVDSMDEQAPTLESLPYVVVIIDELADMMMVVGKKVEQLIARIAQKARAAGIHLILATQRPSVDVLTGLIKSNIPTRISFQVSSKIDSRTILDQQGAEQLLGYGDMLFLAPGTGAPLRVHGAFVDDTEVHRVADDWRARGTPSYIEEITQNTGDGFDGGFGEEGQATEEADPLYDQAVEFVIQTRKASISAVQRRFKIGYNRAARLVEEMERTGIVGPLDGGFRDVLVAGVSED
ncbi:MULTISPECIES: DNA translocase FtsK [Legionella]|uniref:DNA translocase FtsK n=1 Tax=Legionella TaxID=445 RepID=UPI000F8E9CB5|nr:MULTISPECIES: DNA translocase FtsK [Legionella]MCP0914291.1 DNA translocase FtsK 4TM domain-containing protein [Legionella sp. 27cVA30]RUR00622.1 DNA translocase FtsK [Legionella septentrionalis]RUR11789.1 DNA translocase FtsK [Legionella septentrionalis]RUR17477.1 DNA translocase FtsK [Legionella septentrionalis]